MLEVSRLSVKRGDARILRDVCWRVERGQHWAILGANGSGKTSLLSALTGYLTPTSGEIFLLGRLTAARISASCASRSVWSVRRGQMMADDEPALETVVSGSYAMIDFWGRATRSDRARLACFGKSSALIWLNDRGAYCRKANDSAC